MDYWIGWLDSEHLGIKRMISRKRDYISFPYIIFTIANIHLAAPYCDKRLDQVEIVVDEIKKLGRYSKDGRKIAR